MLLYVFIYMNIIISCKLLNRSLFASNHLIQTIQSNGFIIIDGDNVRGKSNFRWSKEKLCNYIETWLSQESIQSYHPTVALYFDHGDIHDIYKLSKSQLLVGFSGPRMTVDDVISRDVSFIQDILNCNCLVVTEDNELRKRCRKNSQTSSQTIRKKKKETYKMNNNQSSNIFENQQDLKLINSNAFVDFLQDNYDKYSLIISTSNITNFEDIDNTNDIRNITNISNNSNLDVILTELIKSRVEINKNLQVVNKTYYDSSSRRLKGKLETKLDFLRKSLLSIDTNYERISSYLNNNDSKSYDIDIINNGARLLKRLISNGRGWLSNGNVNGAEETWERVILAEKFRRDVLQKHQDKVLLQEYDSLSSSGEYIRQQQLQKYIQYVKSSHFTKSR